MYTSPVRPTSPTPGPTYPSSISLIIQVKLEGIKVVDSPNRGFIGISQPCLKKKVSRNNFTNYGFSKSIPKTGINLCQIAHQRNSIIVYLSRLES